MNKQSYKKNAGHAFVMSVRLPYIEGEPGVKDVTDSFIKTVHAAKSNISSLVSIYILFNPGYDDTEDRKLDPDKSSHLKVDGMTDEELADVVGKLALKHGIGSFYDPYFDGIFMAITTKSDTSLLWEAEFQVVSSDANRTINIFGYYDVAGEYITQCYDVDDLDTGYMAAIQDDDEKCDITYYTFGDKDVLHGSSLFSVE